MIFFPDLLLGGAGIGGGVCHDESGAALFVQRGVEMLNPEVIAIVGARDAEGVARISGEALLVDLADIERRIRQHEVEAADGVLQVLVVSVSLLDIAAQSVDGEVQPGEAGGVGHAFLAVDGNFRGGIFLMHLHETGGLDEHAAGAARGIEDAAMVRFQDFHDQFDDGGGRVEFPALLALAHGELAEEIFVDEAESVADLVHGDGGHGLEQGGERAAFQNVITLRQHIGEVRIFLLNGAHRFIDGLADIRAFRQAEQMGEARVIRQIDDARRMEICRSDFPPRSSLRFQLLFHRRETHIRIAQENQTEDGGRVFGRLERGIRPELVGGVPKGFLESGVGVV